MVEEHLHYVDVGVHGEAAVVDHEDDLELVLSERSNTISISPAFFMVW